MPDPAATALWLLLGFVLGGAFVGLARAQGHAERQVLALGLVAAALAYVGVALAGAGTVWVLVGVAGVLLYSALAGLGLRHSAWWLAAGWALHAVWDAGLHLAGGGAAFAPRWYTLLCLTFDLSVAAYIMLTLWPPAARGAVAARRDG